MPPGILFVLLQLGVCTWLLWRVVKRLRRVRAGPMLWAGFAVLAWLGIALGWWMAFAVENQVSGRYRLGGFPMPVVIFHLEQGNWEDFVTPPIFMIPALVANVLAGVALLELPLLIFPRNKRTSRNRE
jgi:hypothetical protein